MTMETTEAKAGKKKRSAKDVVKSVSKKPKLDQSAKKEGKKPKTESKMKTEANRKSKVLGASKEKVKGKKSPGEHNATSRTKPSSSSKNGVALKKERTMDYKKFHLKKMKEKCKIAKTKRLRSKDGGETAVKSAKVKQVEVKKPPPAVTVKFGTCDFSEFLHHWDNYANSTLTAVEREELQVAPRNLIRNTSGQEPDTFFEKHLPDWKEWIKEKLPNGSPLMIILSSSAMRAADLNRQLALFKGKCHAAKLIGKDKAKKQGDLLSNKPVHLAVGTPHRVHLLLAHETLKLDSCRVIALDWSFEDVKKRRLLTIPEVVGQGTYGTVKKAVWRGKTVAVKIIQGDMARKAFLVEYYQLSRVKHKNIITLYGACIKNYVCLVMEYAECGSLHKVLHGNARPSYKTAHAFSWMLQCAEGVEYLHDFKPKPLVHRDLKPLNLLLIDHGRRLKICDFGTACHLQTNMTNNKGSAQWMAPEVFEGSKYSEKCDIFSWGIMLWEVLTRRKPFAEVGGTAYTVMWAVHSGQRPPLIQNCPKPIEVLMTRCWHKTPSERPAMSDIVKIMSRLMEFFKGADEPLTFDPQDDGQDDSDQATDATLSSIPIDTALPIDYSGDCVLTLPAIPAIVKNVATLDAQMTSPASFRGSEGDLTLSLQRNGNETSPGGFVRGHRRAGSYDTGKAAKETIVAAPVFDNEKILGTLDSISSKAPNDPGSREQSFAFSDTEADVPLAYLALDAHFQPLKPFPGSRESYNIFVEHCRLAEHYIKIQEAISVMLRRKQDLIMELNNDLKEAHQVSRYQEYQQLLGEKAQLQDLQRTLKADLEEARRRRKV